GGRPRVPRVGPSSQKNTPGREWRRGGRTTTLPSARRAKCRDRSYRDVEIVRLRLSWSALLRRRLFFLRNRGLEREVHIELRQALAFYVAGLDLDQLRRTGRAFNNVGGLQVAHEHRH